MNSVIQQAIRAAGGFTAHNVPSVAVHLAGPVKSAKALQGHSIQLNTKLMQEVEHFLEATGIPVSKGLKVLKSDAAADTLVLTAHGLEGSGKESVIKLTGNLGVFDQLTHLSGNALHLDEPLMAAGVQKTFKSALDGSPLLVRVEPMMQLVDKVIDKFAGANAEEIKLNFTEKMRERVRKLGLADIDLKANNFAISLDEKAVTSLEDLMSRQIKTIDVGAVRIRTPEATAMMAEPVSYTPKFLDKPPQHIDDLFATKALPTLSDASGTGATKQALQHGLDIKRV